MMVSLLLAASMCGSPDVLLLDFTSDSCPPCRAMDPIVQRLDTAGFTVRKIDVHQDQATARRFGVSSTPTFVLLANGREVDRVVGPTSHGRLLRMFEAASFQAGKSAQIRGQSPDGYARRVDDFSRKYGYGTSDTPARSEEHSADSAIRDTRPIPPETALNTPVDPRQRALRATVRLKVEDPRGNSYGTGTLIDRHGNEGLVITCGHIFRDSQGKGRISVDLFTPAGPRTVAGQLISFEAERRDIGIVSIPLAEMSIEPVRVATTGFRAAIGDRVFSIGCDHGRAPSIRNSRVTAINKYAGAPNIEAAGQPVDGRSGGGLFAESGVLIGICFAADPEDDEGLYAALGTIHDKLASINQRRIFERRDLLAAVPIAPGRDTTQLADECRNAPNHPEMPRIRNVSTTASDLSVRNMAASAVGAEEIIVVIRNRDGKDEVFRLRNPSQELLDQLVRESQGDEDYSRLAAVPESDGANKPFRPMSAPLDRPTIRAQSKR